MENVLLVTQKIDLGAWIVLLIFVPFFILFTLRAKNGARFPLRPIAAYKRLCELVSQAAESGHVIHVGMGSGGIGTPATPEALMGLTVFGYIARQAGQYNQATLGTTGDPTILTAAQGILQRARAEAGFPEQYSGRELQFYGPHPFAYAVGAFDSLRARPYLANVLLGHFGAEGLWLAEATSSKEMSRLGGVAPPTAAALMQSSLDETVIGEEVFAAGAYLDKPSHLGSLASQDLMRIIIILTILVGSILTSLGYLG